MVEQLPTVVAEQVKAIQNLKIDKITVWDGGTNAAGDTSTASFLKGMVGSLPPLHELAKQAGVDLPEVLGRVADSTEPVEDAETVEADPAPESDAGKPPA